MKTSDAATSSLVLRDARLVVPDQIVEGASLLIEAGRIERIIEQTENSSRRTAVTLNLNGLTLLPGFIDVHIHGAVGVDTMEASADDLQRVGRFLAGEGVTAWLPTFVPAPDDDYRRAVRAVAELMRRQDESTAAAPAAARAIGLHYEGPFVNSAQCGALRTAYFRTFKGASDVDALPSLDEADNSSSGSKAAHMMTVAPEIDGGIALVSELRRRGWIVSIGHTRAGVEVLNEAAAAGARHMTHFPNAMLPLHHRSPGPIGWGLVRDDVTCDVIADGVHCDPLMLQLILKCKGASRVALISDAVSPAGLGDGEYGVWNETITVKQGRTSNARGSIAGSVITVLDAVRMMLSLGVLMEDVARMASLNPARLLGVDRDYGSIEEGKRADLVALDAEGRVRLTIIGGRIAFNAIQDSSVTEKAKH